MRRLPCIVLFALSAAAQVYSPVVTRVGQADTSSLVALARDIYAESNAVTPRQKAEAIWRFFLTDGRFVKPGMYYHIAGWTYEEPKGEVLDPLKLLNSYGYGLCYHIAPLLEAVFEAGGFEDARVWFLTGHTVAEVFYDGKYHYFDSDMLGYNNTDNGVASVHQIEKDGRIITNQLKRNHSEPWYPADVRANAIGELAKLFTTTEDNWVYPFQRYASGHTMDFVLRPGERMIRYFRPADDRLFYLPFSRQPSGEWAEFPKEISQYNIKTENGPKSQKDSRRWGTGRLEYRPPPIEIRLPTFTVDVASPYVIIDGAFEMHVRLTANDALAVETSTDGGISWIKSEKIGGPYNSKWRVKPARLTAGEHGGLSAVSGTYGYKVRFTSKSGKISDLHIATDFGLNPRTLPALMPGRNEIRVRTADFERQIVSISTRNIAKVAELSNAGYVEENGQGFIRNSNTGAGSITFRLQESLKGFDIGGRFLDLRDGLAPDKYTAEVREVKPWPSENSYVPAASISWSTSPNGPWKTLWTYNSKLEWRDGEPVDRTLRWPEVDMQIRESLNAAYVRLMFDGMAVDDIRLAIYSPVGGKSPLEVTHIWRENGIERRRTNVGNSAYAIEVPKSVEVDNVAVILKCRPSLQ